VPPERNVEKKGDVNELGQHRDGLCLDGVQTHGEAKNKFY